MSLGQYINIFEQNDITEFLMLYLDKLNSDLSVELLVDDDDLQTIKQNSMNHPIAKDNPMYANLLYDMDIAWLNTIKKEYSPIMDLFYGQLVSQIVCGNCNHIHHNYETYCNISVSIDIDNDKDNTNLDRCLQNYFKDEIINLNEKEWTCDECKVSSPSKKSTRLWKNPNILIVSLKRFNHNLVKNNKQVSAPLQLNLGKYCLHTPHTKYNLVAVGNHQGGFGSGHYNCACLHKNNKWYAVDDVMVREAHNDEINYVLNNGYLYFYECQSSL